MCGTHAHASGPSGLALAALRHSQCIGRSPCAHSQSVAFRLCDYECLHVRAAALVSTTNAAFRIPEKDPSFLTSFLNNGQEAVRTAALQHAPICRVIASSRTVTSSLMDHSTVTLVRAVVRDHSSADRPLRKGGCPPAPQAQRRTSDSQQTGSCKPGQVSHSSPPHSVKQNASQAC